MYDFLTDNNLSPNPSGFRSGASSISQLLSINGDILNALDKGYLLIFQRLLTRYDMMVLFLNCVNGISGDIINILQDFFVIENKVILNGQFSSRADGNAGVFQGSLFLIYVNDLSDGLTHFRPMFHLRIFSQTFC